MNEQIKLLAEQAKNYALDAMMKITDKEQALKVYSESYDTKFAELIVLECGDFVATALMKKIGQISASVIATDLVEHFGVEA